MRFGAIVIAALTISLSAFAADPFVGIWKQDDDKSLNSARSGGIRIESAGVNRVKITQDLINAAGKKFQSVGEFTLDGSDTHPSGPETDFTQSFRSINANVWERIAKRPGDTTHGHWAVSKDGKLLIITGFGKDPKGKEYYLQRVLEKQ